MCGIVGIISQNPVAFDLYDSLIHLQHRGQNSAGIMTCNNYFYSHIKKGLVQEIFNKKILNKLSGNTGIAHVRYPTSGNLNENESQPFRLSTPYGISLAHNGNLVNRLQLTKFLKNKCLRHLNTDSDSECLIHLLANSLIKKTVKNNSDNFFKKLCDGIKIIHKYVEGSYSVVSNIIGKGLIAFRDPKGIRPLVMGIRKNNMNNKNKYDVIFSSENSSFFSLGFNKIDDVKPGEIIFVNFSGKIFRKILSKEKFQPCIFEYVYFARPDSKLDDVSVYRARLRMGQNLAINWRNTYPKLIPDIVIPVPFTSNTAALSFANEMKVRYSEGLYKNPFIGRTFIMSENKLRKRSVIYKISPQPTEIRGKSVMLIDDSIVRGTTSREIVNMIRECGASKVFFASCCPPLKYPCFYGIDIPTYEELIASNKSFHEIKKYMNVDALLYQKEEDLVEAIDRRGKYHIDSPCMACLNGKYICKKKSKDLNNAIK